MAVSPPEVPARIFISYRREDTAYPAGWLFDRLTVHFRGGQVFKDVDSSSLATTSSRPSPERWDPAMCCWR